MNNNVTDIDSKAQAIIDNLPKPDGYYTVYCFKEPILIDNDKVMNNGVPAIHGYYDTLSEAYAAAAKLNTHGNVMIQAGSLYAFVYEDQKA